MRFLASTLAIVALSNIAAAQPMQRFESVEPHMGTLVRVTLYALDEQSAKDAFRAAFDRINALDEILSDYRPASELNAITGLLWAIRFASARICSPSCPHRSGWRRRLMARSTSPRVR